MSWFKVDDAFHASPKVQSIPARQRLAAVGLWTVAGSWCSQQMTDGFVPNYMIEVWKPSRMTVESLVNAGLWDREREGFVFRSWSEYNPTRSQTEAKRAADAERKRAAREKRAKKHAGEDRGESECPPGRGEMSERTPSEPSALSRPDPTRPDPTRPSSPNGEENALAQPSGSSERDRARRFDRILVRLPAQGRQAESAGEVRRRGEARRWGAARHRRHAPYSPLTRTSPSSSSSRTRPRRAGARRLGRRPPAAPADHHHGQRGADRLPARALAQTTPTPRIPGDYVDGEVVRHPGAASMNPLTYEDMAETVLLQGSTIYPTGRKPDPDITEAWARIFAPLPPPAGPRHGVGAKRSPPGPCPTAIRRPRRPVATAKQVIAQWEAHPEHKQASGRAPAGRPGGGEVRRRLRRAALKRDLRA